MVVGALNEVTIISAPNTQPTNFDISAFAVIDLEKHGVSHNIMNAMLAAARRLGVLEQIEDEPQGGL